MKKIKSNIFFSCPECKAENFIGVDIPFLEKGERKKGANMRSEGMVELSCPACGKGFLGYAGCDGLSCSISIEDFDEIMTGDLSFPTSSEAPLSVGMGGDEKKTGSDPYDRFMEGYRRMMHVGNIRLAQEDENRLNELLLMHSISLMETFLQDYILDCIVSDRESMLSFIKLNGELSERKITLKDMCAGDGFLKDIVTAYLEGKSYRYINEVRELYLETIGVDIKNTGEGIADAEWSGLEKCLEVGNYLIHGSKKYDIRGVKINKDVMLKKISIVRKMVENIYGVHKHAHDKAEYFVGSAEELPVENFINGSK